MITEWLYEPNRDNSKSRELVKKIIKENNYNAIDVGAGVNYWSYPECLTVADIMKSENFKHYSLNGTPIKQVFNLNLQNSSTWGELNSHVENHGKFDYSICSHTLEDIVNPFEVINFLTKISKRGFIAVPTKFDELHHLYGNKFRGNPHHKYIFDVIDDKLHIFPKSGFIELNPESDNIAKSGNIGSQLCIFWDDSLDYFIFGDNVHYSDNDLIGDFYNKLKHNL